MTRATRWLSNLALLATFALPSAGWAATDKAAEKSARKDEPYEFVVDKVDIEALSKERAKKQYPVQRRISRYLNAAAEELDAGDIDEANATLNRLDPKRLNPYERALVFRLKAFIAYTAGDYEETIFNFEEVLSEETLGLPAENKIRFQIAQLYAGQQQWQDTIEALKRWFRYVDVDDPLAHYLLGIAYFQLDQMTPALYHAAQAVDLAEKPGEGFLQLLAALYIQKEDYASAAPVFEELVMRFPKKSYWVQLSLIYGAKENYRHSLAVQQVAYAQGLLTEDKELRRLARSYLFAELPYRAARVLEKGLEDGTIEADSDSYEMLANSWIAAREYERSLPPLRKAAELAEDGNLFVRIGQVHLQQEAWTEAAEQFEKGIAKGGLDNLGHAELLLGIAYYNGQRVALARSSFERASKHDATRTEAEGWLNHIARETQS